MTGRARPRALRALAAAVALTAVSHAPMAYAQQAVGSPASPAGEGVAGSYDSLEWMELAGPAGFRDIGPQVGLHPDARSYSVFVRDMNVDGWPDLFISRHSWAAVLFLNQVEGGESVRLVRAAALTDEI